MSNRYLICEDVSLRQVSFASSLTWSALRSANRLARYSSDRRAALRPSFQSVTCRPTKMPSMTTTSSRMTANQSCRRAFAARRLMMLVLPSRKPRMAPELTLPAGRPLHGISIAPMSAGTLVGRARPSWSTPSGLTVSRGRVLTVMRMPGFSTRGPLAKSVRHAASPSSSGPMPGIAAVASAASSLCQNSMYG